MNSLRNTGTTTIGRSMIITLWIVGSLAAATALGLAALVVAETIGGTGTPHGWDQTSEAFSVVNAVFSALALIVVGITLWLQYNELRAQRNELRPGEATQRTNEAYVRRSHVDLIRMALEDEDLAEVWPAYDATLTPTERKQFLYANLMLSHTNLIGSVVERSPEYQRRLIDDLFRSPVVRRFWKTVRADREVIRAEGTDQDKDFDHLCDEVYHAVATVVSTSASSTP